MDKVIGLFVIFIILVSELTGIGGLTYSLCCIIVLIKNEQYRRYYNSLDKTFLFALFFLSY